MLEKPDLQDEVIAACLRDEYGLNTAMSEREFANYSALTSELFG